MQMHRIFEREAWTLDKVRRRYIECMEHCPEMTKPAIRRWVLGKRENKTKRDNSRFGNSLSA
jgi:hypothetical protein